MANVLEKYFNSVAIKLAYHRVQCWPDRMVKDQAGIRAFKADLEINSESKHQCLTRKRRIYEL